MGVAVEVLLDRFTQLASDKNLVRDMQLLSSHLNSSRLLSPKIKWSLLVQELELSERRAPEYGSMLHEIIETLEELEDDLSELIDHVEALKRLMNTAVASQNS
jgi:hypothetical protein